MPRVQLSDAALADLERLEEFHWRTEDSLAYGLLAFSMDALRVLTHQPGIGRPVEGGLRELIISRGRSGYLARYVYYEVADLGRVLRIRHQRESGYSSDEI